MYTGCVSYISSKFFGHTLQDEDKETIEESLGAAALLPVVRGAMGILEKALMPFAKKLKHPKVLGALQSSSAVDNPIVLLLHDAGESDGREEEVEPALEDDRVDTTAKVRGILSI